MSPVSRITMMAALLIASGACGGSPMDGSIDRDRVPEGASAVRIVNDGAVSFTNLRVQTSERDKLPTIETLQPGQTSTMYVVGTMHNYPYIVATARGREVIAHPVEGFSGFNAVLRPGTHLIRLRLADDGATLDVRVLADSSATR